MQDIYPILNDLHIEFEKHQHPAVFTVAESEKYDLHIDAGHSKNLFLRNKKANKHYLVVVSAKKKVDLKNLAQILEESRLSFASPQRLQEYLALTSGSVSPFGLINDKNHKVIVIIDKDLVAKEKVAFHPNINTATLVISNSDLKKFLDWTGNKIKYLKL